MKNYCIHQNVNINDSYPKWWETDDFYFLHAILYCHYIIYCLNFYLNNEMLKEIYYLYDKIKQNRICIAKGTMKMVSSRSFPKGWNNLECPSNLKNVSMTMRTFTYL